VDLYAGITLRFHHSRFNHSSQLRSHQSSLSADCSVAHIAGRASPRIRYHIAWEILRSLGNTGNRQTIPGGKHSGWLIPGECSKNRRCVDRLARFIPSQTERVNALVVSSPLANVRNEEKKVEGKSPTLVGWISTITAWSDRHHTRVTLCVSFAFPANLHFQS
jgi:hypothetical protein